MTSEVDDRRFLPTLAYSGAICFRCYKGESAQARLLKCGKCLRVAYCSTACQKADWKRHKPFCKAMHELLNDASQTATFTLDESNTDDMSPSAITLRLSQRIESESQYLQQFLGRLLTPIEKNILAWEPNCMACSITTRLISLGAGEEIPNREIRPCPGCAQVFFCCDSHWNLVKESHTITPSPDSVGGFSQCQLYQWVRENEFFSIRASNIADPNDPGPFRWFPRRIKHVHDSLEEKNWWDLKEEYTGLMNFPEGLSLAEKDVQFRAVTEALSIPLTILYVMDVLNEGDVSWRRKATLTIHVLGSPEYGSSNSEMFEEILHFAPGIKTLKVVFVGSGYQQLVPQGAINLSKPHPVCSLCEGANKKLLHEFRDSTYHSYMQDKGYRYIRPDVCVVFHPRVSPANISGWRLTIELLKKRHVPTFITAYTRSNAETEYYFLESVGVKLIEKLSLQLNPFGGLTCRREPHVVAGFIAANLWISGAFRG